MIFKTKDPGLVGYLRACHVRDLLATVELETDGGKDRIQGKVLSIIEPEP
jgi:hypothetical protein